MKVSYIRAVIACATLYAAHQMQAATLPSINRAINESSIEVFDTPLYKKAFSDAMAMAWTQAVAQAADFITDMSNSMNDRYMLAFYQSIKKANDELISAIQSAYKELFKSTEPAAINTVNVAEKRFDAIKNAMTTTENGINELNKGRKYVIPQQEEVRALLFTLASKIKANASIAQNQIEEERAQRAADAKQKAKAKAAKKTSAQAEEQARLANIAKEHAATVENLLADLPPDPKIEKMLAGLPSELASVPAEADNMTLEELDAEIAELKAIEAQYNRSN
jgi:hypothetical protein